MDSLRNSHLFRGMSDAELADLVQKFIRRELKDGEVLFQRNDQGDALYLIESGMLRIVTEDSSGRTLELNRCSPGEVIGEMALIDAGPRSAGAIADGPVTVLELRAADFRALLDDQPGLGLLIVSRISARLRFATTYLEKAIDWSKRIAAGDYSMAINQIRSSQEGFQAGSDEARATELLAAFFQMVEEVKAREDALKQQLEKLSTEIDESKRRQEVEAMSSTGFYQKLREDAARLRQERAED